MSAVAVLPARGGSKRIPRKNVRSFGGRPLLEWPIRAARSSNAFDRVIVSTDDDEVATVALAAGAEVPFRRPTHLADDHSTTAEVMRHAASWLGEHEPETEACCCIYPTAAFLSPSDLIGARAELENRGVDYVLAVQHFAHPVQRAMVRTAADTVQLLDRQHADTRTQDLPEAFHDAGQFLWGTLAAFRTGAPILSGRTAAWMLPRWRAIDIDTEEDWMFAEQMFVAQQAIADE